MAKKEIKFVCEKCKKDMPIDFEKSNTNWTVYKTVCECGGNSTIKVGE